MDRDFGRFAMKLRYGQVAMKILRYGPIGETRAESPATGPAKLNKYKKERPKPLPFLHNNHHNLAQDETHFRNRGNPIQPQKQDTLSF